MVESVKPSYVPEVIYGSGEGKFLYPYTIPNEGDTDPPTRSRIIDPFGFCSHCNLTFENSVEYEHHNVELHGHRKVLTCDICTATFKRQDHLKRHIQSLHANQKFCLCPVCGMDCKRQDLLMNHIKRKHSIGDQVFRCRECDYACESLTKLEKHEYTHLSTERHLCPHCQVSFKRKDHMLRHVKSQHLNQFVVCPLCSHPYKRKDHLVRHIREKHQMGYTNGKLVKAADII